jgi:hypothetical protein
MPHPTHLILSSLINFTANTINMHHIQSVSGNRLLKTTGRVRIEIQEQYFGFLSNVILEFVYSYSIVSIG